MFTVTVSRPHVIFRAQGWQRNWVCRFRAQPVRPLTAATPDGTVAVQKPHLRPYWQLDPFDGRARADLIAASPAMVAALARRASWLCRPTPRDPTDRATGVSLPTQFQEGCRHRFRAGLTDYQPTVGKPNVAPRPICSTFAIRFAAMCSLCPISPPRLPVSGPPRPGPGTLHKPSRPTRSFSRIGKT